MNKVEYSKDTVVKILAIINTIDVVGIETINKFHTIISLLDSGTLKEEPTKESNVRKIKEE